MKYWLQYWKGVRRVIFYFRAVLHSKQSTQRRSHRPRNLTQRRTNCRQHCHTPCHQSQSCSWTVSLLHHMTPRHSFHLQPLLSYSSQTFGSDRKGFWQSGSFNENISYWHFVSYLLTKERGSHWRVEWPSSSWCQCIYNQKDHYRQPPVRPLDLSTGL